MKLIKGFLRANAFSLLNSWKNLIVVLGTEDVRAEIMPSVIFSLFYHLTYVYIVALSDVKSDTIHLDVHYSK